MHFQFFGHYAAGINESRAVPSLIHHALMLHLFLYLFLLDLQSIYLVKGQMDRLTGPESVQEEYSALTARI